MRCYKKEMELSLVTLTVEEFVVLCEFRLWLCTVWDGWCTCVVVVVLLVVLKFDVWSL